MVSIASCKNCNYILIPINMAIWNVFASWCKDKLWLYSLVLWLLGYAYFDHNRLQQLPAANSLSIISQYCDLSTTNCSGPWHGVVYLTLFNHVNSNSIWNQTVLTVAQMTENNITTCRTYGHNYVGSFKQSF